MDQLEDNTHLPTILQSLGCIAQNAMPIFETREDEIIKFVVRNVLRRPNTQVFGALESDCGCLWLARSSIPKGIEDLIKIYYEVVGMRA